MSSEAKAMLELNSITSESRVNPNQTNTPMKSTASTGNQSGELYKLAGKVNRTTLRRRMFEPMVERKEAALEIEVDAYMLNMERDVSVNTISH